MAVILREPALLWAWVVIPVLIIAWAFAVRRRRALWRVFGAGPQPTTVTQNAYDLRAFRAVLTLTAVALAILSWAGPRVSGGKRHVSKRGVDLVFAIDFSKSMWARDIRPNRLLRAKAEVESYLYELGGDRVGVVAFAGETLTLPMTTDYDAVALFLSDLTPADMPVGGTSLTTALLSAKELLERTPATAARTRAIIVLSDGEDHEGDLSAAAEAFAQAHIRVYILAMSTTKGAPIPLSSARLEESNFVQDAQGERVISRLQPENEAALQQLAERTSGMYLRFTNGGDGLRALFRDIRRLRQHQLRTQQLEAYREAYFWPLFVAFILLCGAVVIPDAYPRSARRATLLNFFPWAALLVCVFAVTGPAHAWTPFEVRDDRVEAGNRHLSRNQPKLALQSYAQADNEDPKVAYNRGLALLKLGKHQEARQAMMQGMSGDSPKALRQQVYYHTGLSWLAEGDAARKRSDSKAAMEAYRKSIDASKQALRLAPGEPKSAWNMEVAMKRLQQQKREQQKQSSSKDPSKPSDPQNKDSKSENKPSENKSPENKPAESKPAESKPQAPQNQPPKAQSQNTPPKEQNPQNPQSKNAQGSKPDTQKGDSAAQRSNEQMKALLDSLRDTEQSFQQMRARKAASSSRNKVTKDW